MVECVKEEVELEDLLKKEEKSLIKEEIVEPHIVEDTAIVNVKKEDVQMEFNDIKGKQI